MGELGPSAHLKGLRQCNNKDVVLDVAGFSMVSKVVVLGVIIREGGVDSLMGVQHHNNHVDHLQGMKARVWLNQEEEFHINTTDAEAVAA